MKRNLQGVVVTEEEYLLVGFALADGEGAYVHTIIKGSTLGYKNTNKENAVFAVQLATDAKKEEPLVFVATNLQQTKSYKLHDFVFSVVDYKSIDIEKDQFEVTDLSKEGKHTFGFKKLVIDDYSPADKKKMAD